jgi:hypothetical protein
MAPRLRSAAAAAAARDRTCRTWPEHLQPRALQERRVERRVLADDRVEPDELLDLARDRGEVRRVLQLRRIDAGQERDAVFERPVRIDERLVTLDDTARVEADRGDLDDLVAIGIGPVVSGR